MVIRGFGDFMIAIFKAVFAEFSEVKITQNIIFEERNESSIFSFIDVRRNPLLPACLFSVILISFMYVSPPKR